MRTDKQFHLLLGSGPEAFRLLTGIALAGAYRARSVTLKALERRIDQVFEPETAGEPVYLVEVQAQRSGDVYDRLVTELSLYRQAHPGRMVFGLVLFLDASCDEPHSPWRACLGHGPLLPPVYLDAVLAQARDKQPDHPLLAACLPLLADERELAAQAPAAWRRLESLTEPGAGVLMDVFMSWLLERCQGQTYEEVLRMLQVLTPLEETRAYRQLVGIGMERGLEQGRREGIQAGIQTGIQQGIQQGRQDEARAILTRQLRRRFGELPGWALVRLDQAPPEQLEDWAERIFEAADLDALLGAL